jgi:hypothetical protein
MALGHAGWMRRNLLLALLVATMLFLVNDLAPSPMGCSSAGCAADIAAKWARHGLIDHAASFFLPLIGLFGLFQWLAPALMAKRARDRERMWGRPPH